MGGHPVDGGLLEFTFSAETRPMTTLDPQVLTRIQELADRTNSVYDAVFCLDETLGSLSVDLQIDAFDAKDAATRGTNVFTNLLSRSGISKTELESINVEVTTPKQ